MAKKKTAINPTTATTAEELIANDAMDFFEKEERKAKRIASRNAKQRNEKERWRKEKAKKELIAEIERNHGIYDIDDKGNVVVIEPIDPARYD